MIGSYAKMSMSSEFEPTASMPPISACGAQRRRYSYRLCDELRGEAAVERADPTGQRRQGDCRGIKVGSFGHRALPMTRSRRAQSTSLNGRSDSR